MENNLNKTYDPKEFEDRIYAFWEKENYFHAEVNPEKKPYTIMMPPPNVTGKLHMGHAIDNTLQDILIRWKRMQGYEALWMPGMDHASISTESKVVQKLRAEGRSKDEVGREGFLEEAWEWTKEYGGNIRNQLKKIGVSCDWERERFTLDDGLSKAVEEVFIRLHKKDLIYQGDRIINWCPNCGTAISDAEVEHIEEAGHFWHIKYPFKDSDEFLVIATTRPETMLGDTAVAVHPDDERYQDLVGRSLILPLVNKEIPLVADTYVDKEFGTGAVKITPAHDPNDFEVGARHNLEVLRIMDDEAKINEAGGIYAGMDRYEARKAIVRDLEEQGYLVEVEDHSHNVGHCERCKTTVEPLVSKQWFVKMEPLAKPAIEALKSGDLTFVPERFSKVYLHWLENIRDWCISRQLWWGHRLPVYYCDDCGEVMISQEKPVTCSKCDSENLRRDPDTLDTWFSSALWPFSTLGWPENTKELDYFYPTDVLVTGYDIIFFWVVRMVFSGMENMGENPFKHVLIHGLIRDSEGKKMSKSLGNGIDPLEVIDQYGADALRFSLITGNSPGNDMRFYYERVESNRNFANKLWNAARFVLMNLTDDFVRTESDAVEDRWIRSRVQETAKSMTAQMEKFELGMAGQEIYDCIWELYCDWYIELVKPRLYGDDQESKNAALTTLLDALSDMLKLLHPFMPFITEEIWSHLPDRKTALIRADWPVREEKPDQEAIDTMEYMIEAIRTIRNTRSELNVIPSKKAKIYIDSKDEWARKTLMENQGFLKTLASASEVMILENSEEMVDEVIAAVIEKARFYLPLAELVDFKKEIERLEKEKGKLEGELKRVNGKLSNKKFTDKAPEAVVEEERQKKAKYEDMMQSVLERLTKFE